ncbi:MAG: PepSY domain-containing protein [Nitrospiraceae bacterium]
MPSLLLILVLLIASVSNTAVWGAADEPKTPHNSTKQELTEMAAQATLSLEDAIRRALERVPGKPVQVELQEKDKKVVWKVTVLKETGGLDRVYIDSRDGSYLIPVFPAHGGQPQPMQN